MMQPPQLEHLKKVFGQDRIKLGEALPLQVTYLTQNEELDLNKVKKIKNGKATISPKPAGGLWTSSLIPNSKYKSDWLKWALEIGTYDEADPLQCYILKVDNNAIVYEINTIQDLRILCNSFMRIDCIEPLKQVNYAYCIDWEKLSQIVDGVRLTKRGEANTRFSSPNLYGWDAESTIWFRSKLRIVQMHQYTPSGITLPF